MNDFSLYSYVIVKRKKHWNICPVILPHNLSFLSDTEIICRALPCSKCLISTQFRLEPDRLILRIKNSFHLQLQSQILNIFFSFFKTFPRYYELVFSSSLYPSDLTGPNFVWGKMIFLAEIEIKSRVSCWRMIHFYWQDCTNEA